MQKRNLVRLLDRWFSVVMRTTCALQNAQLPLHSPHQLYATGLVDKWIAADWTFSRRCICVVHIRHACFWSQSEDASYTTAFYTAKAALHIFSGLAVALDSCEAGVVLVEILP